MVQNRSYKIYDLYGNVLGVFPAAQIVSGTLNQDISGDGAGNINYADNSFGDGATGTLELWLTGSEGAGGTLLHSIDLSTNVAADTYVNGNGSGFELTSSNSSGSSPRSCVSSTSMP